MPVTDFGASAALYLSWRVADPDKSGATKVRRRLNSGENRHLYRLRSWVVVGGEVRALLSPAATLERIADAVWCENSEPLATRWIQPRDCARIAREIETSPVSLGLAERPEQWPYSSAACH